MARAFARSMSLPTLLISQFDQHRLVIGGGGFAVYFHATDTAGDILGDEDEIAAVRAIFPLHMIMKSAGRIVGHARLRDRPRVAIIQPGP